ncbi:protein preY, mitochondrial [Rhodamnia argentea]|uniref:Protein preY, mitochondrial n=1 Tax=Rhodamnia argentea TaxID=178133 RepID=A0A8B8PNQ6_9MYRT|nr:protein preY, mitochondrial [Rhodamnia argentea]
MVRASFTLLKDVAASTGFAKSLSEFLVCPLSKQPLRFCEKTNSLISEAIGVSFPIKNGIPCLVPKDGKILGSDDVAELASGSRNS